MKEREARRERKVKWNQCRETHESGGGVENVRLQDSGSMGELNGNKLVPLTEKDDIEAYLVTHYEGTQSRGGSMGTLFSPTAHRTGIAGFSALPIATAVSE